VPAVGDTLQLVLPGVLKPQTAPTHEVYHGPRDEDLRRHGMSRNARANDDRYPSDLLSNRLHLTGVDAGPEFKSERLYCYDGRLCTAHSSRWSVEGREEAVTGRIYFIALVAVEFGPHASIVGTNEFVPGPVPHLRGQLRRSNNVREKDCEEDSS
jgi:hypothetical protein